MIKTIIKRCTVLVLCMVITFGLFGCNLSVNNGKRIVRIAIAQSETHPEYLGLVAFKEYVEERLGDKYEVQIFPNELLILQLQEQLILKHLQMYMKYSVCHIFSTLLRVIRL